MATSPGVMARALLASGIALAVGVWLAKDSLNDGSAVEAVVAEQTQGFSLLCFDPMRVDGLRWNEGDVEHQLRRSDRWRDLDGRPVESQQVKVLLNQLRQRRSKPIADQGAADLDPEAMGFLPPSQWLEASAGDEHCRVELGLKHPQKALWSVRVIHGEQHQLGWAVPSLNDGLLLRRRALRAQRIVPIPAGHIDEIALTPQLGQAFELKRIRGGFRLLAGDLEGDADPEAMEEILASLVGLKADLSEEKQDLEDADLRVELVHGAAKTALEFFVIDGGVVLRSAADQWLITGGLDRILTRPAKAYRDRRVVRYDRGAVASVTMSDENGLDFRYQRHPQPEGVDRWTLDGTPLTQSHRLAALQWELHTLRAEGYVDDLERLECGPCRRVVVQDAAGATSVDLRLLARDGGWLVQNGDGPVLRVADAVVSQWPFGKLN